MLKKSIIIIGAIIVAGILLLGYVFYRATTIPSNNVDAMLKGTIAPDKKIVICFGDSITHGAVSFDYVRVLAEDAALKKFIFVNEGVNSRLVYNLLQVVDKVVAVKPHYVFILIGTNDLKGSLSDDEYNRYNKLWKLPQRPTKQWFADNYNKLVDILKAKTDAAIVLISIPPLGENCDSVPFTLAMEYSKTIKQIAAEKKVLYIPFNEILSTELIQHGKKDIPPYTFNEWFMYTSIVQHYLCWRSWNAIADRRGLLFTPDNIHCNERSGMMLTETIKNILLSSNEH